jgi:hypothetical protein
VRAGARNARGRRSLFGVEQLRPAAASRGALVGGGGVEERAVPSRFFNCRACVPVYRSTSRPHGPPYREALAGGALRLRPDRIRGCPAAVPPAPAAAAVCLYLPPPQDTFGRRSVEIDTPFACEKRQLPTLSRAVSRAYANANHCESIHLHTAFAPANAAACAFGGHILTCCADCSCRIEPTRQQGWDGGRGNCRERHGQATMQGSNNAGRRPDHNRGRAEQGSKVRADKHAPALPGRCPRRCRHQQRSRSATVPAEPPSGELLSQLSGCLTRTGLSFSPKWQLFDHEPLPPPALKAPRIRTGTEILFASLLVPGNQQLDLLPCKWPWPCCAMHATTLQQHHKLLPVP